MPSLNTRRRRLYFEQVFAILRLWGFPNAENCRHIAYELVVLPEGKMSSREGTVVSYRELRDEAVRRATEITRAVASCWSAGLRVLSRSTRLTPLPMWKAQRRRRATRAD